MIGDRFFADEAIPGEVGEIIGIDLMRCGLNRQIGVTDQANQRRHNHELEQAQIVDFRYQQMGHALKRTWPLAGLFGLMQSAEYQPFAIVWISEAVLAQ